MIQIVNLFPEPRGCEHPTGHPVGLQADSIESLFANLPDVLKLLQERNFRNAFYTAGHHTPLGQRKPTRMASSFDFQTIVPFDIDHADFEHWREYTQCVALVLQIGNPETLVVTWSGNGLQVLTHLKHPIHNAKRMRELKPAYNELCRKIMARMTALGLPGNVDPVVWEPARILRLPGTINWKKHEKDKHPDGSPVMVEKRAILLQSPHPAALYDLDIHALAGLDKIAKENVAPDEIRRSYPLPDFEHMMRECRFMQWTLEKPTEVHEPHVFDAFSLLAVQAPGKKITFQEKEYNARELGEHIFSHATSSKSCAAQNFDKKWEESTRYGARKCTTISQNWIGGCQQCPHYGKIPTPLALKSAQHISSQDNGFWVLGKNGAHLHPYYSDLAKIYAAESPYLTTGDERIFVFTGKHYEELAPLMVKNWIERKMVPSDPIIMNHRNEFLQKILVIGAASKETEKRLFMESTKGKLNCANGVLDIRTNQLLPHSPTYGFQYVLPYEYNEGDASEYFLNWLSEVMDHRVELMEAVLDVMAYCLWPEYDDHVFTYFVGDGGNGKSTLLEVMQALMGHRNFTAVSLTQLAQNRFAPADLEGKLANLCEESSGSTLSYEEMNVIKTLSSGGIVRAERKNQPSFEFPNRAKLIFAANKVPQFKDQGHNIKRRMLVIPFDRKFEVEDPTVKQRLIGEVPAICSLLVRRIQEKIKDRGVFKVYRGGPVAAELQERVLLAGNSVIEWAKESLESAFELGDDTFVTTNDAYYHYVSWCKENNFNPMNKIQHGIFLGKNFLPATAKLLQRKIGGRNVKIYTRTRMKEEAML